MSHQMYSAAILVISDTASRDATTDKCAPTLANVFQGEGNDQWVVAETKIVPDSMLEIQRAIMQWTEGENYMNLIVTSGGTGFAVKDNTPEVLVAMCMTRPPLRLITIVGDCPVVA